MENPNITFNADFEIYFEFLFWFFWLVVCFSLFDSRTDLNPWKYCLRITKLEQEWMTNNGKDVPIIGDT